MISPDPLSPAPTLRLQVRRCVFAAAITSPSPGADCLASVATIRLENGVFQPARGLELENTGRVSVLFPDARTLQIAVSPRRRLVRGQPVAVFAASFTALKNLAVRLDEPAIALVGELSHPKALGEISVQLADRPGRCTLAAPDTSRPFAFPARPAADKPAAAPPARPADRAAVWPARTARRLRPQRVGLA